MDRERSESHPRRSLIWLNLLWAMPLSLACSYPMVFLSGLEWCGIYGCLVARNEIHRDPLLSTVFAIVAGAISALPLILIPWTRNQRRRSVIAASYGLLYVVILMAIQLLDPSYGGGLSANIANTILTF